MCEYVAKAEEVYGAGGGCQSAVVMRRFGDLGEGIYDHDSDGILPLLSKLIKD